MTGLFTIPKRNTESLRGSGDQPFGAGQWVGTIEEIFIKDDLPSDNEGKPFAGYASTEGEEISIQLGSNTPLDGQEDVGNRKFFVQITTADNGLTLATVDTTERKAPHWKLQRSVALTANLAIALGYVEDDGENVTVREDFIDALKDGAFKDQKIGFVVYHRKGKKNAEGKVPLYDAIDTFFAYVD